MINRFGGVDPEACVIQMAHTHNDEMIQEFKKEVEEAFPGFIVSDVDPLSLSVSCHIGPGSLAIAVTKILKK